MDLTYYETLDTVAVPGRDEIDLVSSLKLELLRGNRVALSYNHAFDSPIILKCLKDAAFRELILRGSLVVILDDSSVIEAFDKAIANDQFEFLYQPALNGDVSQRKLVRRAIATGDAANAGDLSAFVDDVFMIDALLRSAPRFRSTRDFRRLFSDLQKSIARSQPSLDIQRLLGAGYQHRSDLDHRLRTEVPDDVRPTARRLVDACYCLAIAVAIDAGTLVVSQDWPPEVKPQLIGSALPAMARAITARELEVALKIKDPAAALSWQTISDFLSAHATYGASSAAKSKRHQLAAAFLARGEVEQGRLELRSRVISRSLGTLAGGLAWSVPAFLVTYELGQSLLAATAAAVSGLIPGSLFGFAALEGLVVRSLCSVRARRIAGLLKDRRIDAS
jgi:hypothetical protein